MPSRLHYITFVSLDECPDWRIGCDLPLLKWLFLVVWSTLNLVSIVSVHGNRLEGMMVMAIFVLLLHYPQGFMENHDSPLVED